MTKQWDKKKACAALGISQVKFEPKSNSSGYLHGWAEGCVFAVNPDSKYPGAAGFHEISHIVLGHTVLAPGSKPNWKNTIIHELEACASAIICLRELGGTVSGIEAQREHYTRFRRVWATLSPELPSGFKDKVNSAAQKILDAGRV